MADKGTRISDGGKCIGCTSLGAREGAVRFRHPDLKRGVPTRLLSPCLPTTTVRPHFSAEQQQQIANSGMSFMQSISSEQYQADLISSNILNALAYGFEQAAKEQQPNKSEDGK